METLCAVADLCLDEHYLYSNMPLNFDGVICLPFSLAWVVLSWVAVFVADAITYYAFEELPVPYYKLFGKVVLRFKKKKCNF